jgi:putative transposase
MNLEQSSKPYHSSYSLVYSCQYHVIWCPKYRRKVLQEPLAGRLKALIEEKQDDYGYTVMGMEIMPDHVHLLLDANPQMGIVSIVARIKGYTSHVLRTEYPWLKKRLPSLWTRSKFISTLGAVSLEVVQKYIENQKGV